MEGEHSDLTVNTTWTQCLAIWDTIGALVGRRGRNYMPVQCNAITKNPED